MALSVVQSVSAIGNQLGSVTLTITSTTAGNLLLISACETNPTIALTPSVVAGTGQTFTSIIDAQGSNGQLQTWYVKNCAAGTTQIKVTRASGIGQWVVNVVEISGADTTSPLDQHNDNTTGAALPSVTTTSANEYWWGLWFAMDNSGVLTLTKPGAPWNDDVDQQSNQGGGNSEVALYTAYQIVSSTGTPSGTATWAATGGIIQTINMIVTIKAAASSIPSVASWAEPISQPTNHYKVKIEDV